MPLHEPPSHDSEDNSEDEDHDGGLLVQPDDLSHENTLR